MTLACNRATLTPNTRQASADGRQVQTTCSEFYQNCKKINIFLNFITIFGISMENAFNWVLTVVWEEA